MATFIIFQETVHDQAGFDAYRKDVPEMIAAHGGKFVVRGGAMNVLEGEWPHPRVVVIEFPTRAAAEGWYNSPEYQQVLPLRVAATIGSCIIVDGL